MGYGAALLYHTLRAIGYDSLPHLKRVLAVFSVGRIVERLQVVHGGSRRPDRFFTAEQQRHLEELMANWHSARDAGLSLSGEEQAELDALVEAELQAATDRAAAMESELGS